MSYQVLARRWRPQVFADVVGQDHVVRALANALDNDRVHHAILFAGTRGVGKTTLARILARALNCERGVSSQPCGECGACTAVQQGRFVDLIEVDAASRTRVDDTRELLDNVQYAPVQGRFKVYLIDEVHMLSAHSFNALLKTLEEPPGHVKFLLATTDPQKLPATILSRCLQFNLRALTVEEIVPQLDRILVAESVEFEPQALRVLARAADGSLRDGLSLLDQAIVFGGGRVTDRQVRDMLGMIERDYVARLLTALAAGDGVALLEAIGCIAERAPNYAAALDELLLVLHHLCLYRVAPAMLAAKGVDTDELDRLVALVSSEDGQLFYQIGLIGKRDLVLAPDSRTGFEMVLLRMLAFRPVVVPAVASDESAPAKTAPSAVRPPAVALPRSKPATANNARPAESPPTVLPDKPAESSQSGGAGPDCAGIVADPGAWAEVVAKVALVGIPGQIVRHIVPQSFDGRTLRAVLDPACGQLCNPNRLAVVERALAEALATPLTLAVEVDKAGSTGASFANIEARRAADTLAEARQAIENDPYVQEMIDRFDATIIPDSIQSADKGAS